MKTVKIRNIEIGAGRPKICVPIVAKTEEEIIAQAEKIVGTPAQVVEWRCDWFDEVYDTEAVIRVLQGLRKTLGELVLLMTFRTSAEGGEKAIDEESYARLNIAAAQSGCTELIDVEIFRDKDHVKKVIEAAHEAGVKVVGSNHDFHATPAKEELVRRLCYMQEMGADLPKIAVMPTCRKDVLTLLCATQEMADEHNDTPVITMSMSATGVISRVAGEAFGSALTFGALGKASAPGQMGVQELETVLDLLHASM